jgi:endonuclease YncB( thermonuclease family)
LPAHAEFHDGNRIIILDGDTVALPCASPSPGCAEKIRFIDIDAPETLHPDCDAGLADGLKAKARLVELIRGHQVWVEHYNRKNPNRRHGGPSDRLNLAI